MANTYYVYILKCADNTLYTGWTTDVSKRVETHNSGKGAISIHDKYSMGIYQPDKEQIVVAIVIQLEKMIEARNENRD